MTNEILSVINAGETGTTEFKNTFQKEVIETVVAFANAKGGQILIGVSDAMHIAIKNSRVRRAHHGACDAPYKKQGNL